MEDRLSRVLAFAGVASRRESDRLIQEGHVTVNGEIILEPGQRVDPDRDHIKVDGKLLKNDSPLVYLLLNKPKGVLTSRRDPDGRPTVLTMLRGFKGRVVPVGRLESDDEGAMLLTTDNALAAALNAPDSGIPQTWLLKVRGTPDDRTLVRMRTGVPLEKGRSRPMDVQNISSTDRNTWLKVTVREVRSQLFDHMLLKLKHPLMKARRTTFANLSVKGLQPGTYRQLTLEEHEMVKGLAANPPGLPDTLFLTEEEIQAQVDAIVQERRNRVQAIEALPTEPRARRPRIARPRMVGGAVPAARPGRDEGVGKLPRAAVARSRSSGQDEGARTTRAGGRVESGRARSRTGGPAGGSRRGGPGGPRRR